MLLFLFMTPLHLLLIYLSFYCSDSPKLWSKYDDQDNSPLFSAKPHINFSLCSDNDTASVSAFLSICSDYSRLSKEVFDLAGSAPSFFGFNLVASVVYAADFVDSDPFKNHLVSGIVAAAIVILSYVVMYFIYRKARGDSFDADLSMASLKKTYVPYNYDSSLYGVPCSIIGRKVFTGNDADQAEFNFYVIGNRLRYLEKYAEELRFRKKLSSSFKNVLCLILILSLPILGLLSLILSAVI